MKSSNGSRGEALIGGPGKRYPKSGSWKSIDLNVEQFLRVDLYTNRLMFSLCEKVSQLQLIRSGLDSRKKLHTILKY
jgi:hypothetical protein